MDKILILSKTPRETRKKPTSDYLNACQNNQDLICSAKKHHRLQAEIPINEQW